MPVPGSGFKADVLLLGKVAFHRAEQADRKEDRADHNVETVEACRHEEAGEEQVAAEGPVVMGQQLIVFIGLERGEQHA